MFVHIGYSFKHLLFLMQNTKDNIERMFSFNIIEWLFRNLATVAATFYVNLVYCYQ